MGFQVGEERGASRGAHRRAQEGSRGETREGSASDFLRGHADARRRRRRLGGGHRPGRRVGKFRLAAGESGVRRRKTQSRV